MTIGLVGMDVVANEKTGEFAEPVINRQAQFAIGFGANAVSQYFLQTFLLLLVH